MGWSAQKIQNPVEERTSYEALVSDEQGFMRLSAILRDRAGVNLPLTEKNRALMAGRLGKVLARFGLRSYEALAGRMESGDAAAVVDFLSAMTTHTTQFFREADHFSALQNLLPEIVQRKRGEELRIWCAAASTGEEVWSIASSVHQVLTEKRLTRNFRILATDIDGNALRVGAQAVYPMTAKKEIPENIFDTCFVEGKIAGEQAFRVRKFLRPTAIFAEFNLLGSQYKFKNKFDVIFCRNVLIYFARPDAEAVVHNLVSTLAVGGYLFVGHSEAMIGIAGSSVRRVGTALYEKRSE